MHKLGAGEHWTPLATGRDDDDDDDDDDDNDDSDNPSFRQSRTKNNSRVLFIRPSPQISTITCSLI